MKACFERSSIAPMSSLPPSPLIPSPSTRTLRSPRPSDPNNNNPTMSAPSNVDAGVAFKEELHQGKVSARARRDRRGRAEEARLALFFVARLTSRRPLTLSLSFYVSYDLTRCFGENTNSRSSSASSATRTRRPSPSSWRTSATVRPFPPFPPDRSSSPSNN